MRALATLLLLSLCFPLSARAEEKGGLPPFQEVTRDATVREGFLDTYQKGDHLWLAIPPDRLGKDLLLVPRLDRGIGAASLFGGLMFDRQAASLVAFERHGDRVFLIKRAHRFTAPEGSPEAAAVALSIGESVLQSAPVVTTRPDGAVVIDVHDWFLSDLSNIDRWLRQGLGKGPDRPGQASLDRSRSHIQSVKVFPKNLEISARLTFTPAEPAQIDSLPDPRFLPLTLHYSFAELPAVPLEPRVADDRVGQIITVRKDFSRLEENFFVRYANRWRLEPGEKVGNLWKPKQPIVYYVDRTVPERYRQVVKEGIEAWNAAFEKAGFKDAIRAELLPEDTEPADLRFHSVRWTASDKPDFGAVGPSIVDPRTGEILDADILIEANMMLGFREDWKRLTTPGSRLSQLLHPEAVEGGGGGEALDFADSFAAQGALLHAALVGNGILNPGEVTPESYVAQALKWTVLHEVGHTLGLDHNFRASAATPFEKLHDAAWTREHGLTGSVMDYTAVNLAPPGQENGELFQVDLGPYDRWAISVIYTPDAERAKQLARLGAQRGHDYGMEEHLYTPGVIDPTLGIWDLSDDPLAWAAERAGIFRHLRARLSAEDLPDNASYSKLTLAYGGLVFGLPEVLAPAIKSVGGQLVNRDHVGDPGGRPPFVAVPKRKQLEALALLDEHLFSERAFELRPGQLRQLGARTWEHWGEQGTWEGRVDVPYAEEIAGLQRTTLAELTSPHRLSAIRSAELKYGERNVLTLPELMSSLTEGIWTEAWNAPGRNAGPLRRELQRAWVDRLVELLLAPPEGTPGDARALARRELDRIDERLGKRLAPPSDFDAYTEAHLRDVRKRIGKALTAAYAMPPKG